MHTRAHVQCFMQHNFHFWKLQAPRSALLCGATCGMHVFAGFVDNFFGHFMPAIRYGNLPRGSRNLYKMLPIYSSSIWHKTFDTPSRVSATIWRNPGSKITHQLTGAVTCAVCPESAWLVTFLIGNVSTGVVTWSALRCGASGESGKKVAAAPLSKTAAAAAAAKTWFAKHPLDYMLHNRFPWKRSGRRSSMWPPYSLRRNLSAAACRPCDRSLLQQFRSAP